MTIRSILCVSRIVLIIFWGMALWPSLLFAQSAAIKVAVFDSYQGHEHSRQVMDYLKKNTKACLTCEFRLFPIYDRQGNLQKARFLEGLRQIDRSYSLVQISWNMKSDESFSGIIAELNRIAAAGVVIVGAAGESQDADQITLPIEQTVLGQVKKAILVGELDGKGKLSSRSYFGPRVVAAFSAPKGMKGSSFSSLRLSSKILVGMYKGEKRDWPAHMEQIKKMSMSQWPELGEY